MASDHPYSWFLKNIFFTLFRHLCLDIHPWIALVNWKQGSLFSFINPVKLQLIDIKQNRLSVRWCMCFGNMSSCISKGVRIGLSPCGCRHCPRRFSLHQSVQAAERQCVLTHLPLRHEKQIQQWWCGVS